MDESLLTRRPHITLNLAETSNSDQQPYFVRYRHDGRNYNSNKTYASAVEAHSGDREFSIQSEFLTGTQFHVTFDNHEHQRASQRSLLNPAFTSSLTFQLSQPLLNGFGKLPNLRYILEAKNTLKVGVSSSPSR